MLHLPGTVESRLRRGAERRCCLPRNEKPTVRSTAGFSLNVTPTVVDEDLGGRPVPRWDCRSIPEPPGLSPAMGGCPSVGSGSTAVRPPQVERSAEEPIRCTVNPSVGATRDPAPRRTCLPLDGTYAPVLRQGLSLNFLSCVKIGNFPSAHGPFGVIFGWKCIKILAHRPSPKDRPDDRRCGDRSWTLIPSSSPVSSSP